MERVLLGSQKVFFLNGISERASCSPIFQFRSCKRTKTKFLMSFDDNLLSRIVTFDPRKGMNDGTSMSKRKAFDIEYFKFT